MWVRPLSEEITFDTAAPRRNGATLAALADADLVLAVGSADPPGLERLVRGLTELAGVLPAVRPEVVLNRCRASAGPVGQATAAVHRFTGREVVAALPADGPAVDRAWRDGRPVAAVAPASALVKALDRLAERVVSTAGRIGGP